MSPNVLLSHCTSNYSVTYCHIIMFPSYLFLHDSSKYQLLKHTFGQNIPMLKLCPLCENSISIYFHAIYSFCRNTIKKLINWNLSSKPQGTKMAFSYPKTRMMNKIKLLRGNKKKLKTLPFNSNKKRKSWKNSW